MPKLSSRFCASDYDLTLKSCDDTTFRVHINMLSTHSGGFAAPENTVSVRDDPVALSETSSVLELLLQYLYPGPQPDLTAIEFSELAQLAEAAQKYEVWSAMDITKLLMRNAIPSHGFAVLSYAARHDFVELANEAAKYSHWVPMALAVDNLNMRYLKAFASYVDHCRSAILRLQHQHDWHSGRTDAICLHWAYEVNTMKTKLEDLQQPLEELIEEFAVTPSFNVLAERDTVACHSCLEDMDDWKTRCREEVGEMKKMSSFLGESK